MMLRKPRRQDALGRKPSFVLEPLEVRALFSAVIAISGNTQVISSGDITPSAADFTDFGFMSTTANTKIGKLTHQFIITNSGSSTLTLTGGTRPIVISGLNASDFSVVTPLPGTSIAAGGTASFMIAFTPHGKGLRKATITIPSNDTGTPAFTFAVQGTGVVTTNATSGLEIATVTIGTGTDKAVPGAQLSINYSEYLTNGTNVSTLTGNTSSQFILGIPLQGEDQHIAGWDLGLGGLKTNEVRVLFVPASLAFGGAGTTDVPVNAPLIYVVTAAGIAEPLVAVSGNNVNIAFNDTTPSATDGTLIGTTAPGSVVPIPFTFKLTNGGGGSILYPNNNIVITGKNAANFSTTALATQSGFATFIVTYHPPAGAGTSNAVVNIITNDPLHPDFTFNISGVATPFQDLTATIATANYAAPIITGATTKFKIPVKVTNHGNLPVANVPITFDTYLYDTNASTSTLIATTTTSALHNLAIGKSATVNLSDAIPISIPSGNYEFLVKVNDNHTLAETDYSDNAPLSTQHLNMTQGFYDLTATIGSTNFPAGVPIITGSATKYTVPYTITNTGNLPIPANAAAIVFNLYAQDTNTTLDTLITSASTTGLRNLAVGKAAKLSFSTALPISLPSGSYAFQLKVNENSALTESTLSNNNPVSGQTFNATQGFFDLFASIGTSTTVSAISGSSTLEKIQAFVFNNGNITIPANAAPISVNVYVHDNSSGTNTLISSGSTTALRNVAVGKSATLNLAVKVPIGVAAGNYQLIVAVNENNGITESAHTNNSGQSATAFNVIQGFYNLSGNLSTSTFTATPTASSPLSGKITFAIENSGNLTLPSSQKLIVQLEAISDSDNSVIDIGAVGTLSLASWIPGKSSLVSLSKTLVAGLTSGSYHLAVQIAPSPALDETTDDDLLNQTSGAATFQLTVS
jgi:hypothetical protein